MLFCVLPCSCKPFFAVRRYQPDRKAGLIQHIGHAAFRCTTLQAAQQGILPAEILQSAFQAGIKSVNTGNRFALIPVDNGFFSYLDSFIIQFLLIISVCFQHTQSVLELIILIHLHTQAVIEAVIPAFICLCLNLRVR